MKLVSHTFCLGSSHVEEKKRVRIVGLQVLVEEAVKDVESSHVSTSSRLRSRSKRNGSSASNTGSGSSRGTQVGFVVDGVVLLVLVGVLAVAVVVQVVS